EGDIVERRQVGEQQIVLEHHPGPASLGGHEHRRRGVPDVIAETDVPVGERQQARQRAQRRGLARTVGPEQRDHRPLRHLQRQIQGELAPGDTEARGQGHRVTIHRSRSATSTATDTSSSTRLNTIAASGSDSSARYTANGMVVVRPGKLPAKVMVAPNSPSARAQHNTAPATRPGATDGSVTRRKAYQRPAPSVAAASSKRGSAARSAPSTEITRNGI